MSLANGLSILYLLKEPTFGFVDFCYDLFGFFAFTSALIFKDFFPSTNPAVHDFFLFQVLLGVELGYLFVFFLVS